MFNKNLKQRMNYLNLDKEKTSKTVFELNLLLADYHIYYQKLRNFHWNILGENFFDLHAKFESMYNDTAEKIDELAERILTLRYQPISNYSEYLNISNLKEGSTDASDVQMVEMLLKDHILLLRQMRTVAKKANEAEDEGTIDLIGGYIRDLEKTSWMLDAWHKKTSDTLRKPIVTEILSN
jgi:starvation-inducible DNA-binding protein